MKIFSSNAGWFFRAVPIFIGFVFLLIASLWVGFVVVGVQAVSALESCTPAILTKTNGKESQYSFGCKQ